MTQLRAYDLRHVTEHAARACLDGIERDDKAYGETAALGAMGRALNALALNAKVLVGKNADDPAVSLFPGQRFGDADLSVEWDIVLDPSEGVSILTPGMTNAMACLALAPTGTLFDSGPAFYMEKLVLPPAAKGRVDPASPVETRLKDLSTALNKSVSDLTIYVLEKPRHRSLVHRIESVGAKVALYPAGDVAGSLVAATDHAKIDALMGTGGCPEGLLSAIAIKGLGGDFYARIDPQLSTERTAVMGAGLDMSRWWSLDQLVRTDRALFCATGITSGLLLDGVIRNESLDKVQTVLIGGEASPLQLLTSWHHKG